MRAKKGQKMAFLELKYFSKSLGKATAANIILPENHLDKPLSTFYLLHGLSDDHSVWQRRTSIERYVTDLPMMVVMPDSGRGFYCDAEAGMRWESAIIKDLLPYVQPRPASAAGLSPRQRRPGGSAPG